VVGVAVPAREVVVVRAPAPAVLVGDATVVVGAGAAVDVVGS